MSYRTGRSVSPKQNYHELLTGLTKRELQKIRKNWRFEGISHLNKEPLVEALSMRIPSSLDQWLNLIVPFIYDLLQEIAVNNGMLCLDLDNQGERELHVLQYLQQRGVVFYGRYRGNLLVIMPQEIQAEFKDISGSKIKSKLEQNEIITSLSSGLLVYYGVYSWNKLIDDVKNHINFKVDLQNFSQVIYEFIKSTGLFYSRNDNLIFQHVADPDWVIKEQKKRPQVDFYEMDNTDLLYAGRNFVPPPEGEYQDLVSFLESNQVAQDKIKEIIYTFYLDVNNNLSLSQAVSRVQNQVGFTNKNKLEQFSDQLAKVYNNTRQWILKGNLPLEVAKNESKEDKLEKKDKLKNVIEFGKSQRNKQKTGEKKDVGRNDPCPCGSGKKYKKCCWQEDRRRRMLEKKLNQGMGDIDDRYFSKFAYIEQVGYPVVMFDYFLLEIVNVAGHVLKVYNNYGAINKVDIEDLLAEVVKVGREFYNQCQECENKCLDNPDQPANIDKYLDQIKYLETFPPHIKKGTALNLFYFELLNHILAALDQGLIAANNSQEKAFEIRGELFNDILNFIVGNCYLDCGNRCIRKHDRNSYCDFCQFSSPTFACPVQGEISYEEIKANKEDMKHN